MTRKFATDRTDPHFVMYWVTDGPFPKKLADVLLFANREGLISADDLPDRFDEPEGWMAEAASIDRLLAERGAWDAYRQMLTSAAFASQCPFWCHGDHPQMGNGGVHCDLIFHKLPVAGFPRDGRDIQTVIYQWQGEDGLIDEPDIIEIGLDPDEELTGEELVHLAEGHLAAVQILADIRQSDGAR
jgi:hypothetical protein